MEKRWASNIYSMLCVASFFIHIGVFPLFSQEFGASVACSRHHGGRVRPALMIFMLQHQGPIACCLRYGSLPFPRSLTAQLSCTVLVLNRLYYSGKSETAKMVVW
jgi:hypothetical protein